MAKAFIDDTHLTDIADAIRATLDESRQYLPSEMAAAIDSIPIIAQLNRKKYFQAVPAGAASGYANIEKVEGNTVVFNQLCKHTLINWKAKNKLDYDSDTDIIAAKSTASGVLFQANELPPLTGHVFYVSLEYKASTSITFACYSIPTANTALYFGELPARNSFARVAKIAKRSTTASPTENWALSMYKNQSNTGLEIKLGSIFLADLTAIFGAGNEPTTVADFEAWLAQNGLPSVADYNAGELLSVKMNGMQTEDSSQQTLDTLALDVTTITGINTSTNVRETIFPNGMKQADRADTVKDELDILSGTATVRVGSRAYQSGDESDPDVLTDGTTTHFPSIEGYKRLDNVTIPSSSYLITNIQPRGDIHIEMDFETTTFATGGQQYMGGRDGYAGSGIGFGHDSNRNWICDGLTGTRYTSSYTMLSNTRYVFRWLNGIATLLTGGISVATNTFSPTITPTTPLSINGYNINGGVSAGESIKVYAFRAWNSQGEMIANYVPVVNITTSQVGLYDFVSGAFLQPTAGTWTAGTVLLPITYTDLQDANGNPLNPRYKVEQGGTEQVLPVNTSTPTTVAPTLTTTYTKENN